MSTRSEIWAVGLIASLAVHGVVLAGLNISIRPEPVVEQPMPTSELEVQAYQLDRSEAREQRPESQPANSADASGASVVAGAIPQSRASALPAAGDTLPGRELNPDRLRPDETQSEQVQAVQASSPQLNPVAAKIAPIRLQQAQPASLNPATARLATLAQVLPQAANLPQAPPATVALAAVLRPDATLPVARPAIAKAQTATPAALVISPAPSEAPALPETRPQANNAPQIAALGAALEAAAPEQQSFNALVPASQPALESPPNADKLTAALALSGADGGEVDPVSLAAFQSFVRPGDVAAAGNPLRDGVAALLAQVPCSRLQVGFDPDTATLQVNGHIPEDGLRGPVLEALHAQMGADISISDNILILPRPQCGALTGIGDVGLPQSTDQITNPLLIGDAAQARVLNFVKNQRLFFDITAPDYDAYVYVDYFDADGNVLHLAPNDQVPLKLAAAKSALRIGTKHAGDAGLQILIGPPYGQEITVAFAASHPLYNGLRPLIEPAAPYLEWLKTRVSATRADHPDFKGEWVYFFVTTAEK